MASDLERKIIRQVEYFFDDSNLSRDKFLQEKINENEEGWVPIEDMLKFKRLASLSKDSKVIANALGKSKKKFIVVSEDKMRIKRNPKQPLPADNEEQTKKKSSKRLEKWTKCLGIALKETDYICQLHFKEDHVKTHDCIEVGDEKNFLYLEKKKLKEGALPTLEHQYKLHPKLQRHHVRSIIFENQEEQLHASNSEEHQEQCIQNNDSEIQQPLVAQQVNHDFMDFPEQTHDDIPQQPTHDIMEQQEQQIQIDSNKSIYDLKIKINKVLMLPEDWWFMQKPKELQFMRIDPATKQIRNHICLKEDLSLTVICSNNEEIDLCEKITSLDNIYDYLKYVEKWPLCMGTQMERKTYSKECKGVICSQELYKRNPLNPRCKSCRNLRNQLLTHDFKSSRVLKKSVALKNHARNVTKQCKRLKTAKIQLRQKIVIARSECAKKSKLFIEKAIKDLPTEYQRVVKSCFEAAKKSNSKGRRYTLEWVYECLLIRLKNRNTYEFLRHQNILPLPSVDTLNKYIRKICCSAYGFQPSTFKCLKERCQTMDKAERHGVILVDEMKLSESVNFDPQAMKFNGFIDLGQHTLDTLKNTPADHALVFMFVPFRCRWAQTIGCFLSRNACTSALLHKLMIESIILLENSGIHVDAIVTDGATWNRGVWNILGIDEDRVSCEHPYDSQRKLWMLSDFNHLVKCFRNGIFNDKLKEFETPYGFVQNNHWEAVIEEENYLQPNLKVAHKLTPAHLKPKGFQKMNVPMATQVFDHQVSVAMAHYQPNCDKLKDSIPTQKFIDLMFNLIQSMSSRIPRDALRMEEDCKQRKAILSFLEFLEEWEQLGKVPISKSTLVGFKVTLRATLEILTMLHKECNYQYLMTATLSQDPLERFFSVMRFSCGGNDHPDPKMFGQVYRLMSCFSLIRPPKGCNVTGTELLKSLMEAKDSLNDSNELRELWLQKLDGILENSSPSNENCLPSEHDHNYNEAVTSNAVQSYIAGFIGRKLKKIIKCQICIENLQMDRDKGKELNRNDVVNKMDLYGGLFYASDELFMLTKLLEECVLKAISKSKANLETIQQVTEEIKKKKIQMVGCFEHSKEVTKKIIDVYIVMRAHFLAKSENKRYESARVKAKMHRKNAKLVT